MYVKSLEPAAGFLMNYEENFQEKTLCKMYITGNLMLQAKCTLKHAFGDGNKLLNRSLLNTHVQAHKSFPLTPLVTVNARWLLLMHV